MATLHFRLPTDLKRDDSYLRVKRYLGDGMAALQFRLPTVLWLVDYENNLNFWLDAVATLGLVLSLTVMITGTSH